MNGYIHLVSAQSINFYPDQFGNIRQNLTLINPIYFNTTPLNGIKAGSKARTGAFNDINTLVLQGNLTLEKNKNTHWVGADMSSEQEGPVIRKNRIRFHYALQKNIAKDLFISLGTHIGLASYSYNGKSTNAHGSSQGPDGSLGLLLNYKTWNFGTHLNQIFNQIYQPKTVIFKYPTYFGYYLDKTWKINYTSELKVFHLHHILSPNSSLMAIGATYDYNKILDLSLTYNHRQYLTPSIVFHIKQTNSTTAAISVFFAYNIPIQSTLESKINSVEIGLKINCFDFIR